MSTVIIAKPGEKLKVVRDFDLSYEGISSFIGGYLEALGLTVNDNRMITMYMHEEGKLEGLPLSVALATSDGEVFDVVAGNLLICATDDEGESVELTISDIEAINKLIRGISFEHYPYNTVNEVLLLSR